MTAEGVLNAILTFDSCDLILIPSPEYRVDMGIVGDWLIQLRTTVEFKVFLLLEILKVDAAMETFTDRLMRGPDLKPLVAYYLMVAGNAGDCLSQWEYETSHLHLFIHEYITASLMTESITSGEMAPENISFAVGDYRLNVLSGNVISMEASNIFRCQPPSMIDHDIDRFSYENQFIGETTWLTSLDGLHLYSTFK